MDKPILKVLQVTPWFPPDIGGIATHVLALSKNLMNVGINISVLAPRNIMRENGQSDANQIEVSRIPSLFFPGWPYPTLRSVSVPVDLGFRIRSLIKHGKYDLVHVHDIHYPLSWITIFYLRRYDVPSVLTIHGTYSLNPNVMGGKTKVEDLMYRHIFSRVISRSDVVIGLAQNITQVAKRYGTDRTRYYTLGNGVNTEIYRNNLIYKQKFRKKYKINDNSTVMLFVGRLEYVKGILEFAKAIKEITRMHDGIEVLIVGSGSLESQVKLLLGDNKKVQLIKWYPNDLIHQIYIASDIFVIPSKFEGLPVTLIEAMNANLHIVYSAVGGIPEILDKYSMKTVLREVTPIEIRRVIEDLMSYTSIPKDEKSLAYAQSFDWSNITEGVAKIYRRLLEDRSRQTLVK